MVTGRDQQAIDYIENLQVLTTKTINELVYNNMRVCQRRLACLTDEKVLIREKNLYSKENIYSTKPINPKQLRHKLARVDFYMALSKIANVKQFLVEPDLESIRPDALTLCQSNKNGKGTFFSLEVETSNNRVNMVKYEAFLEKHYDKYFKIGKDRFKVVVVTSKLIPKTSFQVVKIKPDLSNISDVLL